MFNKIFVHCVKDMSCNMTLQIFPSDSKFLMSNELMGFKQSNEVI